MPKRRKRKTKPPSLPKPPLIQNVPNVEISGSTGSEGKVNRANRLREVGSSPYIAIVALLLALIGLPLTWEYYMPEVTVNEGSILDPSNVLSSAFQITNTGHFAVRSIEPCIMPDLLNFGINGAVVENGNYICSKLNFFPILRAKETKSLPLTDIFYTVNGGYVTQATFRVRIHYKYLFVIPRTQYFGFRTFRDSNGVLHLFKEPN